MNFTCHQNIEIRPQYHLVKILILCSIALFAAPSRASSQKDTITNRTLFRYSQIQTQTEDEGHDFDRGFANEFSWQRSLVSQTNGIRLQQLSRFNHREGQISVIDTEPVSAKNSLALEISGGLNPWYFSQYSLSVTDYMNFSPKFDASISGKSSRFKDSLFVTGGTGYSWTMLSWLIMAPNLYYGELLNTLSNESTIMRSGECKLIIPWTTSHRLTFGYRRGDEVLIEDETGEANRQFAVTKHIEWQFPIKAAWVSLITVFQTQYPHLTRRETTGSIAIFREI